jgi:hypothetical protein
MKALEVAMEKKGWTIKQTSLITGVTDQSIRNLLRRGETRETIPANVTAFTMVRLLEAFPSLDCDDFVAGTSVRVVNRSAKKT